MIESRTFTVESHTKVAFNVMHELWRQQQLCDVVLSVDGHQFHAHKIVLDGCSPYLRAMFTNGMLESDKDWVEIRGTDHQTMAFLLEFMYCGSIEITVENVQTILQGASLLGLHSLRNLCAHFLQSQLTASNCLGIHYFADMYTCIELEATARHFIYQNFLDVIRTEEYLQLSEERLLDLLSSDKLQVTGEHQVFEAACHWLQRNLINQSHIACRFLQAIKLTLLDMEYLENIVRQSEWVRDCPKCQVQVSRALLMKQDNKGLELITPRAQPPSIYVVGGRNSIDSQLNSVERYDFLMDQWSMVPSMNIARTAVGATSYSGMLYAVGGECAMPDSPDDTLYLRCVECYDPIIKQWVFKAELKIARSFIAMAAVGGYLYAVGGEDRSCSYNIVEKYDPRKDVWMFGPSLKRRRAGAGVTVCDGKIFVAGGYDKSLHMDRASVECFDPETDEWTLVAEMEKPRSGLVLMTVDHFIYAFGGRCRHTDRYFDIVERYNTVTRQWNNITPMNTPRAWPGVTVFDGRIYVLGGFDGSSRLRTAEMYDPETNRWTYINSMITPRAGCSSAVV